MSTNFTRDLYDHAIPSWTEHVVPVVSGVENAHWLEVGCFEGRSALWTLDHILTGKGATITCVDAWETPWSRWLKGLGPGEQLFDDTMKGRTNVIKCKGRSAAILPSLATNSYHGAYIDADHWEAAVYRDALMVWPLLRVGAVLIFDDYGEGDIPPGGGPCPEVKPAVDRFWKEHSENLILLHKQWQVIFRKQGDNHER
jgi:predicted O-methyltransferase YrrM